jgi:uncharacterized protein (TIGR02302 family)
VTEQPSRNPGVPRQPAGYALLANPLTRARWAILWERLWPALASLFIAVGLFVSVSWLGLWLWLPPVGRAIGMLIFFVITAAASVPLLRLRIPTQQEGLRRLDRVSGLPHRPATTVADDMATTAGDPFSIALWRAHLERAVDAARGLKAGQPSPRLAAHDPYALRGLVLVLLVATFFGASGDRLRRLGAAFDFRGVVAPANFRVDAWVNPPLYTGKQPLLLPGLRPGEPLPTAVTHAVPVGSILVVRASGKSGLDIGTKGELKETQGNGKPPAGAEERRYSIDGDGAATIRGYGDDVTFTFSAIPDRAPTITLTKDPETRPQGAMILHYKIEDDYGATEAQAILSRKEKPEAQKQTRSLYDAPQFPLVLPQARTRNGAGQTVKDLTEHPFAGSDMVMTLTVKDQAGNEGRSEPFDLRLPERPFFNPVAKSLIEQRRMLALDTDTKPRVLVGLNALTIAPEKFTPDTNIYLGLRSLYWNLTNARSDDDLRDVVSRMWAMAVQIEDGNMGNAAAQLRAAEEALRQALERNAGDEELKQLMDRLRQALNNFLQALAQEMRRNPDQMARQLPPNARVLREQDLKNMLDRMEQMARSGNKDAARQMLQDLQAMLEGLQMARPGQGMDEDMQALNDLAEMIQRQRELRDKTFKEGQNRRAQRRGQQGQQGQQGSEMDPLGQLRGDQQALRDRLNKMLEEMRKRGLGPQPGDQPTQEGQGDGMDQLGRAGEAMGDAEGQLGQGNPDSAVDSQGRALDAMRRGAQNLAQSMQQRQGQGDGRGPGRPGRLGQARANDDTDPLGRPLRGREFGDDTSVKVPGEIDVQRARRILEELRKRFGESERPRFELDYIERLLKDF